MNPQNGQDEFTFPDTFRTQDLAANGTKLHVRVGGSGPAVVLLHGYGETGDMWIPLAKDLARDRTVLVPDLRGTSPATICGRPGWNRKLRGCQARRRAQADDSYQSAI
jgi:pimeloyl-ACP methyl ester carboxylesterase